VVSRRVQLLQGVVMQREFRTIGEEYRSANTEGFASIVRCMDEVNQGLRGIVSEMTEYSKRSIGQVLEIQAQLVRMAFGPYDAFIARAEALKDAGMAVTKTSKSPRSRAVAQSASVATKRKSGVVKRRTQSKRAKAKRR
jgi:hypothetical protein